ncbi:hypothetical protein M4D54_09215 [Brachybacterium sp. p3-SID1565]|uniref:Uncharacterized protein n=1 Tax=Brachybacterium epidermidis TaxID=2781983 RepID=A0ABR9W456_9MICO|nr:MULTISPECIES: hypothetical protein [Brachybacterium]MBE9405231.1 hypothetical protein [Brachybacterium epidermidis]MCT1385802.1 hypothetical protein [Brachybacterium sp. p3-SID1565]
MSRDQSPPRDEPSDIEEPDDVEELDGPLAGGVDDSQARLKIEEDADGRTQLYERGPDGEWVLKENPPVSDDPEVDAIGQLDYEEIEEILENEDDPRHELAKEYSKRSNERMMQSLRPITDQYRSLWKNVIGSSTAFDLVKKVPVTPKPIVPKFVSERPSLIDFPEVPDVEIPRNPAYDVLEEQRAMNSAIVETNGHLAEMVAQAKADAESSAAKAAEEKGRAQWALGAAWAAVGVTVIVGVVQIIQNM